MPDHDHPAINLATYQRRLLEALHHADVDSDGYAIARELRADPLLAPLAERMGRWEPRSLETAAELARRWGRVDPATTAEAPHSDGTRDQT